MAVTFGKRVKQLKSITLPVPSESLIPEMDRFRKDLPPLSEDIDLTSPAPGISSWWEPWDEVMIVYMAEWSWSLADWLINELGSLAAVIVDIEKAVKGLLSKIGRAIWEALSFMGTNIWGIISGLTKGFWDNLARLGKVLIGTLADASEAFWVAVKEFDWTYLGILTGKSKDWWNALGEFTTENIASIKLLTEEIFETIKDLGSEAWAWLKENAKTVIETVKAVASDAWNWIITTGIDIKAKVLWLWDEVKKWYEENLASWVNMLKPWFDKINATLTLTANVIKLKEAIASGKIESVFRATIELMTTTLADLGKSFNLELATNISAATTSILDTVSKTIKPISDALTTAQAFISKIGAWIPGKLMEDFLSISKWLDSVSQPLRDVLNLVEREIRYRLFYLRSREKYSFMHNLGPAMQDTKSFQDQINLWQFILGRIIADF